MVLVKNDQRRRNGWQHNTTISRNILSDCRHNFSKARVLRHLRSVYPNTSPEEKGKGAEARSQEQMSMSESFTSNLT